MPHNCVICGEPALPSDDMCGRCMVQTWTAKHEYRETVTPAPVVKAETKDDGE